MFREIFNELKNWKNHPDRKPLLITGVRQCGKTYAMQAFGKAEFEESFYVNLEKDEMAASLFDFDYDVKRILRDLETLIFEKKLQPGKTLLILDEIQSCPRAVTALKYFCEDYRELHVMCAGSLLGVALKHQNISFPVGKVDRLQMYPMSFSEFLKAAGQNKYIDYLSSFPREGTLPTAHTVLLERYYRDYLIVGGMPEAVAKWVSTQDYSAVEKIQDTILEDYSSDFSKYAPVSTVPKLHWIWDSIPKQLAKENNKFIFSQVKAGKRAHELEDSLQWLVDSGLVYKTELVSTPELPLSYGADASYFKIYMSDTGLLRRKSGISYRTILTDNDLYIRFKGALTENYVHNELLHLGLHPYFWRSGNSAEVDFLIESDGKLIPIEVKSADNTMAKSFRMFCRRYHVEQGFKFSLKNIGIHKEDTWETISLPLYLIWNMKHYLQERNR